MYKNGRYAVIAKTVKQIGLFTNAPSSVNTQFNDLVDLENHSQRDEVQEDWFYDVETNTFSAEGEIQYPEIEPQPEPEPTEEELAQAELLLNQMDIINKQQEQDEVLATILLNGLGV